jgi:hypothetical protein
MLSHWRQPRFTLAIFCLLSAEQCDQQLPTVTNTPIETAR